MKTVIYTNSQQTTQRKNADAASVAYFYFVGTYIGIVKGIWKL